MGYDLLTSTLTDLPKSSFKLTLRQRDALRIIGSEAAYILMYGGSRSTKTFTAVRTIVWRALAAPNSRHAILRFRFNHVKASIVYDTFPKVMQLCFPGINVKPDKQDWFVRFPNGSEIWFGGLDDKERTEKILGREYATIFLNEASQISYNSFLLLITRLAQVAPYKDRHGVEQRLRLKMLVDENPPTKGHWTYKLWIKKVEPLSNKPLDNPEDYNSLLMNPKDNAENLDEAYLRALQRMPKRQRDRFWEGKFTDDSENALWTPDNIEKNRVSDYPQLTRIVVAVDPSGASDDENQTNDAIGIGVAGLGVDGLAYVLEDLTLVAGPATWGKVATSAYERHKADRIIGEQNFGGAMVEYVVRASNPNVSYKSVTASRGKVVRAEPISALTDLGKIKFVGRFDEMEDELCSYTTTGYIGERSPNRADWFVWAMTDLFPGLAKREEPVESETITIPKLKRI